jgi:type II secretory pathway predicted ATPase ExeA
MAATKLTDDTLGYFLGDREAIHSQSEDLLHRADFAKQIATRIAKEPQGTGSVVGLVGPWGSGKTSVLNMCSESLAHVETEMSGDVIVLFFNPWLFNSPDQLVQSFFSELSAQLKLNSRERVRAVGNALQLLGQITGPARFIPAVGNIADAVSSGLVTVGGALSSESQQPSLQAQHRKLAQVLQELNGRVVVEIDDLDRLMPHEIREVMRLIRLTSDLPNVTYLLAFDRGVVEAALSQSGGRPRKNSGWRRQSAGREYLLKIVDELYDIPPMMPLDLDNIWFRGVTDVVGMELFRSHPEYTHVLWATRPFFRTVRDIRRFLRILPTPIDETKAEVCPVDVVALESLRVFCPDAWQMLPVAKVALTSSSDKLLHIAKDLEQNDRLAKEGIPPPPSAEPGLRALYEQFVEAGGEYKQTIRRLCELLFPATQRFTYTGTHESSYVANLAGIFEGQAQHRRVAQTEVMDFYLARRVPPTEVPTPLMEAAVSQLDNEITLTTALSALSESQLISFLRRLPDYQSRFPSNVAPALSVLGSLQDRIALLPPTPMRDPFHFDWWLRSTGLGHFRRAVDCLLHRFYLEHLYFPKVLQSEGEETLPSVVPASFSDALPTLSMKYLGSEYLKTRRGIPESWQQTFAEQLVDQVLTADPSLLTSEPYAKQLLALVVEVKGAGELASWAEDDSRAIVLLFAFYVPPGRWTDFESSSSSFSMGFISWWDLETLLPQQFLVDRVARLIGERQPTGLLEDEDCLLQLARSWLDNTDLSQGPKPQGRPTAVDLYTELRPYKRTENLPQAPESGKARAADGDATEATQEPVDAKGLDQDG